MGFSIHVWSLYALSLYTRSCELPCAATNRLVAAGTDVPEFIHTHTNSTALQEKLHECVGWFVTSPLGFSDTTARHISVCAAINCK